MLKINLIFLFIQFILFFNIKATPINDKNNEIISENKFLNEIKLDKKYSKEVNRAVCYDSNLAKFINNGLYYYPHKMGDLSNYILNQIKSYRYSGYWFVHAALISGQTQGIHWQSSATGDIFLPSSRHGCKYIYLINIIRKKFR
ncbi:hypothetical protein Mgra_00006377 [Meloidogyne graminicola]|uniref:C-type lectin domain-containing protein n=1 Tax=Meloidogyne graminicola TaxID=189291 RepID=A0A8S9ZLB8_9BILA|nr:hypothetical protein Mgra_00006377 [Meloidogyne graminicola]